MGSCFSSPSKEMKRTDTNKSGNNDLQRTTSSYHGSVADATRYSERLANADANRVTASQLHKTTTLEARLRAAELENKKRSAA